MWDALVVVLIIVIALIIGWTGRRAKTAVEIRGSRAELQGTAPTPINLDFKVGPKSDGNPQKSIGSPLCFFVNGEEQPNLNLKRGVAYRFNNDNPEHPIYFAWGWPGGPGAPGSISPKQIATPTVWSFDDAVYPDFFYYECALHPNMGNRITLQ